MESNDADRQRRRSDGGAFPEVSGFVLIALDVSGSHHFQALRGTSKNIKGRLAEARLQKPCGHLTAFLPPLIQLPAINQPQAHKREQANERT